MLERFESYSQHDDLFIDQPMFKNTLLNKKAETEWAIPPSMYRRSILTQDMFKSGRTADYRMVEADKIPNRGEVIMQIDADTTASVHFVRSKHTNAIVGTVTLDNHDKQKWYDFWSITTATEGVIVPLCGLEAEETSRCIKSIARAGMNRAFKLRGYTGDCATEISTHSVDTMIPFFYMVMKDMTTDASSGFERFCSFIPQL